jgi:alcohol dehydrogenase class IV
MPTRLLHALAGPVTQGLGLGLTVVGNVASWTESLSVGTVVSALTALSGVLILFVGQWNSTLAKSRYERGKVEIDLKAEEELRLKDSLSRQLAAARAEAAESRVELSEARKELAEARHDLMEMIRIGTERSVRHTDANRAQIEALAAHAARLERELTAPTAARVEHIEQVVTGSSDAIPTTGETP